MCLASDIFVNAASEIIGHSPGHSSTVFLRRFRSHFGSTPSTCSLLWNQLTPGAPSGLQQKHLLWGLLFLKCYHTEHVNATIASVDKKTFPKWTWIVVRGLSKLNMIVWNSRVEGRTFNGCYISVDGTDFRIQEPSPFDPKWFSFKFKGAGLRYEVGLSISGGNIVWLHGPFACGTHNDVQIFRERLKAALMGNEKVIGDRGYTDELCITPNSESGVYRRQHAIIRARHETVNRRLKQFNILHNTFRHDISLHSTVVFAVVNVTQAMLASSDPLFDIE